MKKFEIVIGKKVMYYPVILEDGEKLGGQETEIESLPWMVGSGDYICNVKGVRGGVHITHLGEI